MGGKAARQVGRRRMPDHRLEEKIAHLERTVEDLSTIIARQDRALDLLTARVTMLMEREARREAEETGVLPMDDRPPPHY